MKSGDPDPTPLGALLFERLGAEERDPALPHGVPDPPPRLPAGLRTVIFLLSALMVLSLVSSLFALLLIGPEPLRAIAEGRSVEPLSLGWQMLLQALSTPFIFLLTVFFVRTVDRKTSTDAGIVPPRAETSKILWQFLLATASAVALLSVWRLIAGAVVEFRPLGDVGAEAALSDAAASGLSIDQLLAYGAGFIALAFLEELMFRGYIYSAIRERFAWVHAAGWTSLLFVLMHLGNPQVAAVGLLNTCLFGLILGALREWSGHFWTPAIFHAVWNFLLGCILALPISGFRVPGAKPSTAVGSEIWSGGSYGPEGSWLLSPLLLALIFALSHLLQQRSDRLQKHLAEAAASEEQANQDEPDTQS